MTEPSLSDELFRVQAIARTLPVAERDTIEKLLVRHLDDRARERLDVELALELSALLEREIDPRRPLAELAALVSKPDVTAYLRLRGRLAGLLARLVARVRGGR